MWQKLNRIDTFELKRARNQLINASQLVSAGPRSYLENSKNQQIDWLYWNNESMSIDSNVFGKTDPIRLSLDVDQFVISILGHQDYVQHLVLSGITYPMAYGWMKVKMDSFKLDGEAYNDNASYELSSYLGADEEMMVTNQRAFSDLVIYYSNAYDLLQLLKSEFGIEEDLRVNPMNLSLTLKQNEGEWALGFSPGDEDFPEPYFFIQVGRKTDQETLQENNDMSIWHSKDWKGLVLLASDFLTMEPEVEQQRVLEFFKSNYAKLFQA